MSEVPKEPDPRRRLRGLRNLRDLRGSGPSRPGWPSPTRPWLRRRRTGSTAASTRARPRLTGRAAVLVLVVAALMVSYASSFRAYLEQRRHIDHLQESIEQSQRDITELRREKQRWQDPAYVVAQARARFAFAFPGEVGFQVLDEDGKPLDHQDSLTDATAAPDDPEWWQTAWGSVEAAGDPPHERQAPARIAPPGGG